VSGDAAGFRIVDLLGATLLFCIIILFL